MTGDTRATGLHDGGVGEAIGYALEAHDRHWRKGTDVPYAAHLLAVTTLVLEHGGTPDQARAAVLHDVVEDCGGAARLRDVRATFGDAVGDMVAHLSDSTAEDPDAKPPWRDRKTTYLQDLREHAGSPAMLVSLADKTHNAEAIVADLTDPIGDPGLEVFARFSASPMATSWYYLDLALAFRTDVTLPRRLTERVLAAARTIHDHAVRVPIEPGSRRQVAIGHAVHGDAWGVLPIEALEAREAAVARFRNARTVGHVRSHPSLPHDRFEDALARLANDGDGPSDGRLLEEGWDTGLARGSEPPLPDVPWEAAPTGLRYQDWAPAELLALVAEDGATSAGETATRLTVDSVTELRAALDDTDWTIVDDGDRYARVAFGGGQPYAGGWTPLPDQPER